MTALDQAPPQEVPRGRDLQGIDDGMSTEEDVRELALALPGTFFTTPHYDGHPHLLVRLAVIDREDLADLLEDAWRARAPTRLLAERDAG